MTALNKQALRKLAKALSGKEWVAFVHKASGTYAVGSLGHERGEDIIKWPGLDGQDNAESKAKFIAAANPATVLALLDELEAEQGYREGAFVACNRWHDKFREEEAKLEAAEKRIAELESRTVTVKLPDIMPPEAAPAHYWGSGESMAYADGYNKSAADLKTSFALSCSSAGVNVEFE